MPVDVASSLHFKYFSSSFFFFFFNDTATTEIYTLSLHDALPICSGGSSRSAPRLCLYRCLCRAARTDRKSTRLNSSHGYISYAVFCLQKKNISHSASVSVSQQICCTYSPTPYMTN